MDEGGTGFGVVTELGSGGATGFGAATGFSRGIGFGRGGPLPVNV